MTKNSARFNIWIKPYELAATDELCRRKGYNRSTFIREVLGVCVAHDLSPAELNAKIDAVSHEDD
ncbi:MAG: hypothetical protein DBY32_09335 [Phascolarctobacterium sp.]|nr:MAG: hypothetical protein DBY32_09335 [Phascolarctobacterium sp.]